MGSDGAEVGEGGTEVESAGAEVGTGSEGMADNVALLGVLG